MSSPNGKECWVGLDYHVEIDKHFYSVQYQLMREELSAINAQITSSTEDKRLIDLSGTLKADDTKDGVHLTEVGAQRWRSTIEAVVCPSWSFNHAAR